MQLKTSNHVDIKLNLGVSMKIDKDDWDKFKHEKWFAVNSHGRGKYYVMKRKNKKTLILHRLIMNVFDKNIFVDHINHDTLDNRKINLRLCNRFENARNRQPGKNNTSKYLGVTFIKRLSKWQTQIKINGKNTYVGVFKNEKDAALAYDRLAKEHHKEFANLNFK